MRKEKWANPFWDVKFVRIMNGLEEKNLVAMGISLFCSPTNNAMPCESVMTRFHVT